MSTADRSRGPSQEIPAVSFEIQKHGNPTVWFVARRRHELDPSCDHALIRSVEIINAQEQSDSTGELLAYDAGLVVAIGTRQQNACFGPLGTDNDPALRAPVIGKRRGIFDEPELQNIHKETDGGVVVPHDEGDQLEIRHRGSAYS